MPLALGRLVLRVLCCVLSYYSATQHRAGLACFPRRRARAVAAVAEAMAKALQEHHRLA